MDLAVRNSHSRDSSIEFFKESHQYKITRGEKSEFSPVSVTSFCKRYFTQFNPRSVVERHFDKWKVNPNSKYYAVIHAALQSGSSEEEVKQMIMDMWVGIGNKASEEGTDMHDRPSMSAMEFAPVEDKEMSPSWWQRTSSHMKWRPFRTEWMLWWTSLG